MQKQKMLKQNDKLEMKTCFKGMFIPIKVYGSTLGHGPWFGRLCFR